MAAFTVILCEYIKEEGLHIVVQRLMVQEEFGQQAQILTVYCADISIHLEKRKVFQTLINVRCPNQIWCYKATMCITNNP